MVMKKFINNPDNLVSELLEGFALAHGDKVRLEGQNLVVRTEPKIESKVALYGLDQEVDAKTVADEARHSMPQFAPQRRLPGMEPKRGRWQAFVKGLGK